MDDGSVPADSDVVGHTAANRPHRNPHARPTADDHIPGAPETQQKILHVDLLDHQDGVGIFACGWIDDRHHRIAQILIEEGRPAPVDLLREAALSTAPELAELLAAPREARAPLAFLLFLPDTTVAPWAGGLTLTIAYADGTRERCFVPAVGRVGELDRIIERAPLDDALAIVDRVLAAWLRGADAAAPLPSRLAEFAERAHQKIVAPANGRIETALRIGDSGILLRGGFTATDADHLRQAALVSLFGRRVAMSVPLPAIAANNPDEETGFLAYVEIAGLRRDERCWFLEAGLDDGSIRRLPFACAPAPRPMDGIKTALGLVDPRAPDLGELFHVVLAPAVENFSAGLRHRRPRAEAIAYGETPIAPEVSVIVPLYGRIDFLQHQIASFSNDPELRSGQSAVELVYVLDDPPRRGDFERLCRHLHSVYGVPFRTLMSERNLGYSGANNLGAEAASGGLLLLLNSDVLPTRGRWVGQLLKTYRALPRCGVLGCRLLFEDGSIQHAGMTFRRSSQLRDAWENYHPAKGLPTGFDPHSKPARVPAVTGACMVIDRTLFRELGGLSEDYVLGDFEDSDLCLRAFRNGWHTYYTPEVELYHLERQSIALLGTADWRLVLTLYNEWKQARKWGALIPEVLRQTEQQTGSPPLGRSAWDDDAPSAAAGPEI
jgi:GT2 family glycosyltransferase